MKAKLDENLGSLGADFLRAAGVDVLTAVDQGLSSASDQMLLDVCTAEDRCVITLDRDFSNPLTYEPKRYAGIVMVRLPGRMRRAHLDAALAMVVEAAKSSEVRGRLWIAEVHRVREYFGRSD